MKASSWRGATTPAHRPVTLKLSLARHSEQKPQMKKNFCRIWEGRKCRIQQENRHTNRSEKSSFKPVESDQFQIGPRSLFRAWTIQALSATVSATLRAVSPTLAPSRYAVSFTAEIMPCVSVDWPSPIHAESAATVAAAIPSESR